MCIVCYKELDYHVNVLIKKKLFIYFILFHQNYYFFFDMNPIICFYYINFK